MRIKRFLKKNKIVMSIYNNMVAIYYYSLAEKNARKSKKLLSAADIDRIREYKDIHKGERCFIIATGPSQNVHDLEMLKNEITFTVNSGYKAYEKTQWRANYYVLMDDNGGKHMNDVLNQKHHYDGIFCSALLKNYISTGEEIKLADNASSVFLFDTFWNRLSSRMFSIAKFSDDISKVVYCGKTVVYACIQIAAYMGFTEIYLSGVECDYSKELMHSDIMNSLYEGEKKKMIRSGELMRRQFDEIAPELLKRNIKVFNATRGGALESFPRVSLEEILNN